MTLRPDTIHRMDQRTSDLIQGFDSYCDAFDRSSLFTGPSIYFHHKTVALLRQHKSPGDAILDESFLESIYATLTAWGMHRMGTGDTKLVDFNVFVDSFRQSEQPIKNLATLALADLQPDQVDAVGRQIWAVISKLKVGQGMTKIVAGSKALHHVLPELVPPIDREYTIQFFFHHKTFTQGDEIAFREVYPRFHRVAAQCKDKIETHLGQGMNTSTTKVIDNAIVGFVRTKLRTAIDA